MAGGVKNAESSGKTRFKVVKPGPFRAHFGPNRASLGAFEFILIESMLESGPKRPLRPRSRPTCVCVASVSGSGRGWVALLARAARRATPRVEGRASGAERPLAPPRRERDRRVGNAAWSACLRACERPRRTSSSRPPATRCGPAPRPGSARPGRRSRSRRRR